MNWILLTLTYLLTCAQWALLPKILVARETAFASPQHLNHSRNALSALNGAAWLRIIIRGLSFLGKASNETFPRPHGGDRRRRRARLITDPD